MMGVTAVAAVAVADGVVHVVSFDGNSSLDVMTQAVGMVVLHSFLSSAVEYRGGKRGERKVETRQSEKIADYYSSVVTTLVDYNASLMLVSSTILTSPVDFWVVVYQWQLSVRWYDNVVLAEKWLSQEEHYEIVSMVFLLSLKLSPTHQMIFEKFVEVVNSLLHCLTLQ